MDAFKLFSAGSANDDKNKDLWVKGASLFLPQINSLTKYTNFTRNIINISEFDNDCDKLGTLYDIYGSDKGRSHNYHIVYSFIFNKLGVNSKLNVLEIGLGTNNPELVSSMGSDGKPGASLYALRDYLPNASIYGADIDKDILFESERIKTTYVDQLAMNTFDELSKTFGGIYYDLIIDDGLHSIGANLNTLLFALGRIKTNGWIVIEDIHIIDNWKAIDCLLSSSKNFKTYIVKTRIAHLYIVNKL